jgi:hypothetical protein
MATIFGGHVGRVGPSWNYSKNGIYVKCQFEIAIGISFIRAN